MNYFCIAKVTNNYPKYTLLTALLTKENIFLDIRTCYVVPQLNEEKVLPDCLRVDEEVLVEIERDPDNTACDWRALRAWKKDGGATTIAGIPEIKALEFVASRIAKAKRILIQSLTGHFSVAPENVRVDFCKKAELEGLLLRFPSIFKVTKGKVTLVGRSLMKNRIIGSQSGQDVQKAADGSTSCQELKFVPAARLDPTLNAEINLIPTSVGKANVNEIPPNESCSISHKKSSLNKAQEKRITGDYPSSENASSCGDNVKYNVGGTVSGMVLPSRSVLLTPLGKVHFSRNVCDFIKGIDDSLHRVVRSGEVLFCDCELQPEGSPEKWIAQKVWKPPTTPHQQSVYTFHDENFLPESNHFGLPKDKSAEVPDVNVPISNDSVIINGLGKVLHIGDQFGILYTTGKERVFFRGQMCTTFLPKNYVTLKNFLAVGEKVFFNAKVQNKSNGCKWKAEEVWKKNQPESDRANAHQESNVDSCEIVESLQFKKKIGGLENCEFQGHSNSNVSWQSVIHNSYWKRDVSTETSLFLLDTGNKAKSLETPDANVPSFCNESVIMNGDGEIFHIDSYFGVLYTSQKERVYFNVNMCRTFVPEECMTLESFLTVGENVCFNAHLQDKSAGCKWKAEKVWKKQHSTAENVVNSGEARERSGKDKVLEKSEHDNNSLLTNVLEVRSSITSNLTSENASSYNTQGSNSDFIDSVEVSQNEKTDELKKAKSTDFLHEQSKPNASGQIIVATSNSIAPQVSSKEIEIKSIKDSPRRSSDLPMHNYDNDRECRTQKSAEFCEIPSNSKCIVNSGDTESKIAIDWILKKSSYAKGSAVDKKAVNFLYRTIQTQGPLSISEQNSYIQNATEKVQRKIESPKIMKNFLSRFTDIFQTVEDNVSLVDETRVKSFEKSEKVCGQSLGNDTDTSEVITGKRENSSTEYENSSTEHEGSSEELHLLKNAETDNLLLQNTSEHTDEEGSSMKDDGKKVMSTLILTTGCTTSSLDNQHYNLSCKDDQMANETDREIMIETIRADLSQIKAPDTHKDASTDHGGEDQSGAYTTSNMGERRIVHYEQVVEINPNFSCDEFEIVKELMDLLFQSKFYCMPLTPLIKKVFKSIEVKKGHSGISHEKIQKLMEKFTDLFRIDIGNRKVYSLIAKWEYEALVFLFPVVLEAKAVILRDLDKSLGRAPVVVLMELCSDNELKAFLVKFCDVFEMHWKAVVVDNATGLSRVVLAPPGVATVASKQDTPKQIDSVNKTAVANTKNITSCDEEGVTNDMQVKTEIEEGHDIKRKRVIQALSNFDKKALRHLIPSLSMIDEVKIKDIITVIPKVSPKVKSELIHEDKARLYFESFKDVFEITGDSVGLIKNYQGCLCPKTPKDFTGIVKRSLVVHDETMSSSASTSSDCVTPMNETKAADMYVLQNGPESLVDKMKLGIKGTVIEPLHPNLGFLATVHGKVIFKIKTCEFVKAASSSLRNILQCGDVLYCDCELQPDGSPDKWVALKVWKAEKIAPEKHEVRKENSALISKNLGELQTTKYAPAFPHNHARSDGWRKEGFSLVSNLVNPARIKKESSNIVKHFEPLKIDDSEFPPSTPMQDEFKDDEALEDLGVVKATPSLVACSNELSQESSHELRETGIDRGSTEREQLNMEWIKVLPSFIKAKVDEKQAAKFLVRKLLYRGVLSLSNQNAYIEEARPRFRSRIEGKEKMLDMLSHFPDIFDVVGDKILLIENGEHCLMSSSYKLQSDGKKSPSKSSESEGATSLPCLEVTLASDTSDIANGKNEFDDQRITSLPFESKDAHPFQNENISDRQKTLDQKSTKLGNMYQGSCTMSQAFVLDRQTEVIANESLPTFNKGLQITQDMVISAKVSLNEFGVIKKVLHMLLPHGSHNCTELYINYMKDSYFDEQNIISSYEEMTDFLGKFKSLFTVHMETVCTFVYNWEVNVLAFLLPIIWEAKTITFREVVRCLKNAPPEVQIVLLSESELESLLCKYCEIFEVKKNTSGKLNQEECSNKLTSSTPVALEPKAVILKKCETTLPSSVLPQDLTNFEKRALKHLIPSLQVTGRISIKDIVTIIPKASTEAKKRFGDESKARLFLSRFKDVFEITGDSVTLVKNYRGSLCPIKSEHSQGVLKRSSVIDGTKGVALSRHDMVPLSEVQAELPTCRTPELSMDACVKLSSTPCTSVGIMTDLCVILNNFDICGVKPYKSILQEEADIPPQDGSRVCTNKATLTEPCLVLDSDYLKSHGFRIKSENDQSVNYSDVNYSLLQPSTNTTKKEDVQNLKSSECQTDSTGPIMFTKFFKG